MLQGEGHPPLEPLPRLRWEICRPRSGSVLDPQAASRLRSHTSNGPAERGRGMVAGIMIRTFRRVRLEVCRPSLPSHSLAIARSARGGDNIMKEVCQKNLDSIIEGALPPSNSPARYVMKEYRPRWRSALAPQRFALGPTLRADQCQRGRAMIR